VQGTVLICSASRIERQLCCLALRASVVASLLGSQIGFSTVEFKKRVIIRTQVSG